MVAFCQISVQCPCQGEHTNCFFSTPRILLALWLLLFSPKYIERAESCLGSYLCFWQKNENSCCLGTSHSSILGVHIWIKEKCFVKEKTAMNEWRLVTSAAPLQWKLSWHPLTGSQSPEVAWAWTMPERQHFSVVAVMRQGTSVWKGIICLHQCLQTQPSGTGRQLKVPGSVDFRICWSWACWSRRRISFLVVEKSLLCSMRLGSWMQIEALQSNPCWSGIFEVKTSVAGCCLISFSHPV